MIGVLLFLLLPPPAYADTPEVAMSSIKQKKPINVEDIAQELHLAQEASVDAFFAAWMTKPPRKANVGTWFVLHTDETHVYWGKPTFKGFFGKRVADVFYKTSRTELDERFPAYETVWGNTVRLALAALAREHRNVAENGEEIYLSLPDIRTTLHATDAGSQIVAEFVIQVRQRGQEEALSPVGYRATLDATTLECLAIDAH